MYLKLLQKCVETSELFWCAQKGSKRIHKYLKNKTRLSSTCANKNDSFYPEECAFLRKQATPRKQFVANCGDGRKCACLHESFMWVFGELRPFKGNFVQLLYSLYVVVCWFCCVCLSFFARLLHLLSFHFSFVRVVAVFTSSATLHSWRYIDLEH